MDWLKELAKGGLYLALALILGLFTGSKTLMLISWVLLIAWAVIGLVSGLIVACCRSFNREVAEERERLQRETGLLPAPPRTEEQR